jgi:glucose/arabinose dehydrogenase
MRRLAASVAVVAFAAALGGGLASAQGLETRAPNSDYKPAFPGQTRAPAQASNIALDVRPYATGLEHPWAIEFLPDGRLLATETGGRMRIVAKDGKLSAPIAGVPAVYTGGQGGLLDVAVDPDFARNQTIFFTYAEARQGGNGTAVARARLVDGPAPRLETVQVLARQLPTWQSQLHFGSRIVFAKDGTLYVTFGERSLDETRVFAQDLSTTLGKVIRINKDGSVPKNNPFVGRAGAKPEIWSYGHRNPQSAALNPVTGQLWTIEHGPRGGDELNRPEAGKNYGWPVISYGIEYRGVKLPGGATAKAGMEQPKYYWDPVIAPSGMLFYTGALFPAWRNNIFVGGMGSQKLVRLAMNGDRVVGEEWLLQDLKQRIRDVNQGPDGAIYVAADNGTIYRVAPKR